MNAERTLERLVSLAKGDGPPLVDVTDAVAARLPAARASRDLLPWIFTAVSSAAAAAVTIIALQVWAAQQDPFGEFLQSVTGGMP